MKDPYSVLGIAKSSSDADIKKAYRTLAKKLHPDINSGDEAITERFKEVSAAYALLSDKEMRARYDRGEINADGTEKGFAGGHHRQHAGAGGFSGFGGDGFDPEEIFSSFFGQKRKARPRPARGQDKIYRINIDFLDAIKGMKRKITLENGKTLNVSIPENVKEGQQIRLKGQGSAGQAGGPAGDAKVEIHINAHPYFHSEKNDIHLDLPINLTEAVLGGKVNVPTIDGKVALSIPPGSSSGKILRLKGKGSRDPKSKTRGDQYVKLLIILPETIDQDLEKKIKSWGAKNEYDVRSKLE